MPVYQIYGENVRFVRVYEDHTQLGQIGVILDNTNGWLLAYDCDVLRDKRQRGMYTTTKKIDRAIKEIEATFRPPTLEKLAADAISMASARLQGMVSSSANDVRRAMLLIENKVIEYVINNFDAVVKHSGIPEDKLQELRRRVNTWTPARELFQGKKCFVFIDEGKYVLHPAEGKAVDCQDDEDFIIMTAEELPIELSQKVGMLKLVEDKKLVDGIGYRSDGNTFIVSYDKEISNGKA